MLFRQPSDLHKCTVTYVSLLLGQVNLGNSLHFLHYQAEQGQHCKELDDISDRKINPCIYVHLKASILVYNRVLDLAFNVHA